MTPCENPTTENDSSSLLSIVLGGLENSPQKGVNSSAPAHVEDSPILHRMIAYARAQGEAAESIAAAFDLKRDSLESLFSQPSFNDLVLTLQAQLKLPLEAKLRTAAEIAYEKRFKLMTSSQDEKVVEKVSGDFLDRELGKPTARVESINFNYNANTDLGSINKDIEHSESRLQRLEEQQRKLLEAQGA